MAANENWTAAEFRHFQTTGQRPARYNTGPKRELIANPQASIRGGQSRADGLYFESLIKLACKYYEKNGIAKISKTPEPMKILDRLEGNRFIACHEEKAEVDFKGIIYPARPAAFEAKYTSKDRMPQDYVTENQARFLDSEKRFGAYCFVLVSFLNRDIYRVDWQVWKNLKTYFDHKYATPAELAQLAAAKPHLCHQVPYEYRAGYEAVFFLQGVKLNDNELAR